MGRGVVAIPGRAIGIEAAHQHLGWALFAGDPLEAVAHLDVGLGHQPQAAVGTFLGQQQAGGQGQGLGPSALPPALPVQEQGALAGCEGFQFLPEPAQDLEGLAEGDGVRAVPDRGGDHSPPGEEGGKEAILGQGWRQEVGGVLGPFLAFHDSVEAEGPGQGEDEVPLAGQGAGFEGQALLEDPDRAG